MSLIFNPTSGVAYLETEEAVPWASLGGRTYTHFILLETTTSKANAQYVWSTGNYQAANALNMYYAASGHLTTSAGTSSAEVAAAVTSPAFGGGLLRLAVIRGFSNYTNSVVDYQAVNLGFLPGASSVQISRSPRQQYALSAANSYAARKLTLGDRQTTYGDRKFFGTMHFAGSVNRALDDNELIAILQGEIQVLDYFKHNLVELWDFQRGDESALTGLISGTTFKMFGGSNLTWDQSAPLPVSKTRGYTILGATNRSVLAPVWAYGESSGSGEVINTVPKAIALSPVQAGLISTEVLNTQAEALSLTPVSASILGTVTVLTNPATISLSGVNADINLSGQIQIPAIPATITLVANSATLVQYAVINTQPDTLILQPVMAGIYAGEAVVATGSSNGISTVSGNSASIQATTGTSIATATVTGVSSASTVKLGMGSSAGLSVVDGISNSILYRTGIGSSIGSSTAIGYITYDVSNSAAAHGIAIVNGVGYALILPPLPEESRHVPGLTLELSLDKTGLNISV